MSGHRHVYHLTTGMMEDNEDVKDLESNGGHGEKVHSPGGVRMIVREGQPVLRLLSSSFRLDHVLANCIRAGRIETEKDQMSMDPFSAPQDVFATESSDQSAHFLAH